MTKQYLGKNVKQKKFLLSKEVKPYVNHNLKIKEYSKVNDIPLISN